MGQLYTVRNERRKHRADAAVLAGTGRLIQKDASSSNSYRDGDLAKTTAIQVAQTQTQLQGLPTLTDDKRNDLTILFGAWDIYNNSQPWPEHSLARVVPAAPTPMP